MGAHPRQSADVLTQALCLLDGEERKEEAQDFGHSGQWQPSRSACTPVGSGPELREHGGQWGALGGGAVVKPGEKGLDWLQEHPRGQREAGGEGLGAGQRETERLMGADSQGMKNRLRVLGGEAAAECGLGLTGLEFQT